MPTVGIQNDSMSGAFEVESTNILVAPDSIDIQEGFAPAFSQNVEATDAPNANQILIGPDSIAEPGSAIPVMT